MPMSSRGTKIFLSDVVAERVITAATKAAPCVLTVTGATVVNGGKVAIKGTGWDSIDGKVWTVESVGVPVGTVTLTGSDTSAEADNMAADAVMVEGGPLVEICMASLNRDSPASAILDVTTLCDDSRQQLTGMPNNGTWTAQGFYESNSAGHNRIREAYGDGATRIMDIEPPDHSHISFQTQVNQLSESFAVDQPIQMNAGGIIMGGVSYSPPAAAP